MRMKYSMSALPGFSPTRSTRPFSLEMRLKKERSYQQPIRVGVGFFLREIDSYKFMAPDGLNARVLREQGWETNTLTVFRKCEDNSKNYGLVSLTLVAEKTVE